MSDLLNLEAEMAVLGAALDDGRLIERCSLRPGDFSEPLHGVLWAEMQRRGRAGVSGDMVALKDFAAANFPAELGGAVYLMRLAGAAAPLSHQAVGYAAIIRDLAHRRAIVAACKDGMSAAAAGALDGASLQVELEQRLQALSVEIDGGDAFVRKGDAAAYAVERAELGEAVGISTGFKSIDEMIGGLKPALYLLGAASSMGKSTLLAAISRNVAAQGYGVAEFALEMDEMEDGLRAASALAFDPSPRVANPHYLSAQRNVLTAPQWDAMRGSARAAAALHIHTDYRPGRTISQIEAAARRLFAKLRRSGVTPGLVVIDHEGLIAAEQGQRFGSQLERTNARAEALMALPKRLGVPIFVAGQLTKDGKRADGEERLPSGDDWKYGGALIEAAQAVLLVHRKAYYAERKPAHLRSPEDWDALKSRETTIVVDKARGGRRGQTTILMDMPTAAAWEAA